MKKNIMEKQVNFERKRQPSGKEVLKIAKKMKPKLKKEYKLFNQRRY